MIEIRALDFDLEKTLGSGQVFHWEKYGNGFVGAIGENALFLEQRGGILKVRFGETPKPAPGTRALPRIVARYFALDHPLEEICASFPRDPIMNAARDFCRGLRIIRQPKWECLATFICSSMKLANCVMLFAYERIAAFPIDVWIERVLRERYFARKRKVTGQMLADFVANYFGAHGGYAQQYLFHHARMTGKRKSQSHSIDQFH